MAAPADEPSACAGAFSTEAKGLHYTWKGIGPSEWETTLGIFNTRTEQWTLQPTTGSPPPGVWSGGCASVGDHLYCFGGSDGSSRFNTLHKLNLKTFHWSRVHPTSDPSEWPRCKNVFGLIAKDERTLVCFGGYAVDPEKGQHACNKTNEFHLFHIQEGVWSSPEVKGKRPVCSSFSFTKVDQDRAVLFGGSCPHREPGSYSNDLYLFNLRNMEVTKVEPVPGDPWPVERGGHGACCLNYGEGSPKLLVSGGLRGVKEVLKDMWILDVNSGKWTKITPPASLEPRYWHSTTATKLGPGLTEVLLFGGCVTWSVRDTVAETIILRFERSVSVAEEWLLIDVARNNTRGSSQHLREKREKIRQAKQRPSSERAQKTTLEQQLQAAEQRVQDAVQRAVEELRRRKAQERDTERLLAEANHCREDAEGRLREALQTSQEAEQHAVEAERRNQELSTEVGRLQGDLQRVERRAQLAEQRANSLETQWVVRRREIQMTERELGEGGWGAVKVAKFRGIEVAAKSLYEQIRSDYYRHLFIREMNMAARLRHPNLVQFIGATLEGEMIILTELMHTSLRRVLEQGSISREHTLSISVQVCQALNYLHLMQPDPVIHRDISSANVLLNPLPNNGWLAKVTDYGSVNTLRALQTRNPGNPVYSAPEAFDPSLQSTKMDIFSVGVLLIEMCTGQFPSDDGREHLLLTISDRGFSDIISRCIDRERDNRPTAQELLSELKLL